MADDGPVVLGGPKQRAVLAVLLLDAGRTVSTDRLIDRVWGEPPPRNAKTSLQNLVVQLRRLVGADALVLKPPGYVLQLAPGQLDVERFDELRAAAAGASGEERASLLRGALAIW